MNQEMKSAFIEEARKGARKLCRSECMCAYTTCSKPTHHPPVGLAVYGKEAVCPLAKYEIMPNPSKKPEDLFRTYFGKKFSITDDELFALCAVCNHPKLIETRKRLELVQDECWMDVCVDCPVNLVREAIDESRAEYEYRF